MPSSRKLAQTWPYPRHKEFVAILRKAAQEWFAGKGCNAHEKYSYCLADWNDWRHNIILQEVAVYIDRVREERAANNQGFPLHDYIHHGLSSQALLFNLIVPMIVSGDLDVLRQAVNSRGITWPGSGKEIALEYEDRSVFNEDSGQPTSIDLVIGNPATPGGLFVEAKLVEAEFGVCSVFRRGDCDGSNPSNDFSRCYLHHIGRQYWLALDEYGFLDGPLAQGKICVLGSHYQFFREVLFALKKKGYFILLSDERSPTFFCSGTAGTRGLMPLLIDYVPEQLRRYIGHVSIQNVIAAIDESGRHRNWIAEFKLKYGIAQA